ncbi:helix-turn-helix transcriptional regulator [Limnohabitans sp.]
MNKFKEFRQARGYTQGQIAEMLKTTQQSVARWESSQAEPSLAALRDLAIIYNTSVDDLLGKSPLSNSVRTNSYFAMDGGDEHFWGHLGILLPGEKYSSWYPITFQAAKQVDAAIQRAGTAEPWIAVSTLNNRMLLINVPQVQRIYMLDDNADQVADDWELGWDSYQGHSLEVYRALAEWAMGFSEEDEQVSSETFRKALAHLIDEEGLTEDLVIERVVDTHIHFTSGQVRRCSPNERHLLEALYEVDTPSGQLVFNLSESDNGLTTYIPLNAVRLINMPLYQLVDAMKTEHEEYGRLLAKEDAEALLKKSGAGTVQKKRGRPRKG